MTPDRSPSRFLRIRYLSNPKHKMKVKQNAVQDGLTGVIVYNPKFCLVVVEGGAKGLKHYKRLMLQRIDWTEETLARADDPDVPDVPDLPSISEERSASGGPMDELEEPASLADNTCVLVWEGQHRERMFRALRQANCPSDTMAKDALGVKLEGLWDVAKRDGQDAE